MSDQKKPGCGSCKGCPSLKLVEPPTDPVNLNAVEERNFWNTCPKGLDALPTKPCSMGRPKKNDKGRILQEPECPWWIDSEKHNYCFWKYIRSESLPDGRMDSLMQNEIADLFGCSSTKIHFVLKDAVVKLQASPFKGLMSELSSQSGVSPDEAGTAVSSVPLPDDPDPDDEDGSEG